MTNLRLAFCAALISLAAAPSPAATRARLAGERERAPAAPGRVSTFGKITGAIYRTAADPGPIKRMWVIYGSKEELADIAGPLERIKADNPGVEVLSYPEEAVVVEPDEDEEKLEPEKKAERRNARGRALFDRMLSEKVEFVLATSQELYAKFQALRNLDLARDIPMGYAGRNFVSNDIPRASLDPERLSEPAQYPARRFLWISPRAPAQLETRLSAGMEGLSRTLEGVLEAKVESGHGTSKKGDEDMNGVQRFGLKFFLKAAGQADDADTAKLREQAHHLAAYLKAQKIDVLATDDPQVTRVLGLMKRMGYHRSLPVVWATDQAPGNAEPINLAVLDAPWRAAAPHVALSPEPQLPAALGAAAKLSRLPENFMDMGGVSVRGFEGVVADAVAKALPGARPPGVFDVHFMLTNGNGVTAKGDANPFGHFGMAVSDERGKLQAWTVQYEDGGSFTGGLGDLKQLSLGEYLYTLWYMPGAAGQATPLAETAVAPVFDFVLRGIDEAQLEAMRRKAAEINERHLHGGDDYQFLNQKGMTNCISMVTQILRAAGFHIPETTVQDPAGQAVNMLAELSRWLLHGRIEARDFGLIVWERPAHAGPEHYRIPNTALASPLFNRHKPWERMSLWERAKRVLGFPRNLALAFKVPERLEATAALANVRVGVGPQSRDARVVVNENSPIIKLRASAAATRELLGRQVRLSERLSAVETRVLAAAGLEGYRRNPAQSFAEQVREGVKDRDAGQRRRVEADIERHHRLAVALQLNKISAIIEIRRREFYALQLADPVGEQSWKVGNIVADYQTVKEYARRIQVEDRLLTAEEKKELGVLNERLYWRMMEARAAILKRLGESVPEDVEQMLGEVSQESLQDFAAAGGGDGDGKKGGKLR